MQKNVIVFWDWNGTIVDDSFVFVDILNCLLKENSLPAISLKQYRESFCFPIDVFYKKINLYKNKSFFNQLNKRFAAIYKEKMYLPLIKKDVVSVLSLLKKAGAQQYIVSAQNHEILTHLLNYYGLSHYFEGAFGVNNHVAKGKEEAALKLKNKIYNKNSIIFFVGDTELDYAVSKKIQALPLLVSWGHYNKKRLLLNDGAVVFDSVDDLKKHFLSF